MITKFHLHLDKNKDSFRFLMQANNTSEGMWSIYVKCMLIALVSAVSTSICSSIVCYWKYGKFDVAHLYHPYKLL